MPCIMNWEEWAQHDAVGLAERVQRGELTPTELASQTAEASARVNPQLSAVVEVFEDLVTEPTRDGMNPQGPFAGVPYIISTFPPFFPPHIQRPGWLMDIPTALGPIG